MKMRTKCRVIVGMAVIAAGWVGQAPAASLWDDFNAYSISTNLNQLVAQGWGASDAGTLVTNNVYGKTGSDHVAALGATNAAVNTNMVGQAGKVWTECLVNEAARMDPGILPAVMPSAMVMVGVTTDGFAMVYNPASNGWDICTNDARGQVIPSGVASGVWARVSILQDYNTHLVSIFMDGRLVRQNLNFISNRNSYASFNVRASGVNPGYLDDVYASNAIPPVLLGAASSTNDINGNGMPDAQELMTYGALAFSVPADYPTIADAMAASPPGGCVAVSNATYATSLSLSNGVTLVGINFGSNATNLVLQGTMTAGTGTVMVASGQLTVTGMVNIVAGGLLTISNTAANFGGLTIGGGGLLQMVNGSLVVGSYTNSGTFTLSLITNMVFSAGNGIIAPSGTNTMISTWSNVVYTLQATNIGYVVGAVTNNGVVTTFAGTKTATYTNLASNITNNQTIVAAFVYNGIRYVPGDYTTLSNALAAATANDQIVVSDGTYAETLVVSNNVTLAGTNVTGLVSLTVLSNQMVVLSGFTTFAVSTLAIQSGGTVVVSNSTVTANGVTLSGTFTLDSGWGGGVTPQVLNYTNDFEAYLVGLPLNQCGGQGWGASSGGPTVQSNSVHAGSRAALVSVGSTLSNTVNAATGIVWTDFYIKDTVSREGNPYPASVPGQAVQMFVNSNNFVTLWNAGAWDVCSNDVRGGDQSALVAAPTGQWVRVTVCQNFSTTNLALFVNGVLVRQQVPFSASGVSSYNHASFQAGGGASYLDDVKIWTNLPTGLATGPASDLDYDNIPDAREIELYGNLTTLPRGSVFKIR